MAKFYEGVVYALVMDKLQAGLNDYIAKQVPAQSTVLDAGCGTGNLSVRLVEKSRKVVGVDLSAAMLGQARRRKEKLGLDNLELLEGDMTTVLQHDGDKTFDVAIMSMVLHELPNEVRLNALREMTRLAKRVMLVDFMAPQPRNLAGFRNRTFEFLAGREHFAAFRDYCDRGGVLGVADEAGVSCTVERRLDSGTLCLCGLQ